MKRLFHILMLPLVSVLTLALLPSCHSSKKSKGDYYQTQIDQIGNLSIKDSDSKNKPEKNSRKRKKIVEEAYTWLGTPYAYAHAEKGKATDCSGMVQIVYEKVTGIKLPRNSAKQAEYCKKIKRKNLKIGDLVFFATGKNSDIISHVGIMVDDSSFIHASASKGVVVSDLSQPYYVRTLRAFGRVSDDF